jgi:hypothetical protein
MSHVRLLAGEEVVKADHVVSKLDQPLAQVRAQEPRSTGDENSLEHLGKSRLQPAMRLVLIEPPSIGYRRAAGTGVS